jgi:hypothetical protein
MTTEHDTRTRIVVSWLREDAHENAERVLLAALNDIDHTQQRRSWWPARRSNRMNTYAKLIAAAAAVLVVAVLGYQLLPGTGGVGGQPTIAPSPSPTAATPSPTALPTPSPSLTATSSSSEAVATEPSPSSSSTGSCAITMDGEPVLNEPLWFEGTGFRPGTYLDVTFLDATGDEAVLDGEGEPGLLTSADGVLAPWGGATANIGEWHFVFSDGHCEATVWFTVTEG